MAARIVKKFIMIDNIRVVMDVPRGEIKLRMIFVRWNNLSIARSNLFRNMVKRGEFFGKLIRIEEVEDNEFIN